MKVKRKIIEINKDLCDGCGLCVDACSERAIQIVDGKAKLVSEKYCDGLGACIGDCPRGALRIFEKAAEEFDPNAVEEFLQFHESDIEKSLDGNTNNILTPLSTKTDSIKSPDESAQTNLACGCPSAYILESSPEVSSEKKDEPLNQSGTISALKYWPIQIRLIPANAPFLKEASLVIASDCAAVALPNFQRDFLKGKVLMIGCPKFDDRELYIQKFAQIFKLNEIKEVKLFVMEVPCCQGLPVIVQKGMELAKKDIPLKKIIVGIRKITSI